MTDRKAVIKNADMSEEMQQDVVDCSTQVSEILSFVLSEFGKHKSRQRKSLLMSQMLIK